MRESEVEQYLVKQVKAVSGSKAYKWVSPGNLGVPDRIVVWSFGVVDFVELKAPGEKPRASQIVRLIELIDNDQNVYVLDSRDRVDEYVRGELRPLTRVELLAMAQKEEPVGEI